MATEYFNDAWRIPNNKNQSLVSNYSMEFDGTNDKIGFGDVNGFDITDKFSGSCWIYSTAAGNDYILGKEQSTSPYPGYMLYIDTNRKLRFIMAVSYTTGNYFGVLAPNSAIPYNTWTHLVFTYDGSTNRTGLKLYINSVLQAASYTGSSTISGSMLNSTVPFQISGRGGSAVNGINGKIDQTCIFDYELPATGTNSVATLYGGGTAVTNPMSLSPKPVAYYQLGDQSVSTGPSADYLVPNNSLQDYVFLFPNNARVSIPTKTISLKATISLWINYNALGSGSSGTVVIGGGGQNYWPYIEASSGKFVFYIDSSFSPFRTATTTVDVVLNKWFHIALSDDGVNTKAYINGVPEATMTSVVDTVINTIGAYSTGGFTVDGKMSNVAYWQDTNLSDAQILSIYNNGTPNDISSLSPTAWYKLNAQDTFDGSNWTITDYAGSNDGTSSGMTSANLVQSNLQHTSGYSPYALDLDGINDRITANFNFPLSTTNFSFSVWIKPESTTAANVFLANNDSSSDGYNSFIVSNNVYFRLNSSDVISSISGLANTWIHVVGTYDGSTQKLYINNNTPSTKSFSTSLSVNDVTLIGAQENLTNFFNGSISNLSLYNTTLTDLQVTEIYNSGVPSNLNTFSGTAPVAWWQLGSNSSYLADPNPNPPNVIGRWTCLDEVGTNNAQSSNNMTNDAITNGVGYSGNGLGTSSIEIVGDAPYSTANGISENMDVLDRTTDVPS